MLSRRLLRAIVMQALYAFFQSDSDRVDIAERAFLERIEKIKSLFIHQLSFLIEIIKFARERTEDAKHKHIPSKEDLNPNTRLIDCLMISQIESNRQLIDGRDKYKINWTDEKELIRSVYQSLRDSSDYKKFIESENDYDIDKKFIIKILKKYIAKNHVLKSLYEEKSIFWVDDYDFVNNEIIKTLNNFSVNTESTDYLFKDKENFNEDIDFILHLFRKTIIYSAEYEKIISSIATNWENERIATIDMLLMKMAICEILNFTEIPVKVSLNEYIEIAKIYSTPKSSNFINGVLDKILDDFKKNDKFIKTGRGIINN